MNVAKKEISTFEGMQFVISYPNEYRFEEKYPVILFLHGAGSRGKKIESLLENPYFQITDRHNKFPFVTVAPQCHADTWFDLFEVLERFVKAIATMPFADSDRIYLMGASMGGYATWQLAMSMPEYFAAIIPICGGGMYWNASRLMNVPIWAFHGEKDKMVLPEESVKMINAVNRSGGHAKLTIYPDNAHDAWSDTFSNSELYKWFLQFENKNELIITDKYDNTGDFG